jgi:hypothetical protein
MSLAAQIKLRLTLAFVSWGKMTAFSCEREDGERTQQFNIPLQLEFDYNSR